MIKINILEQILVKDQEKQENFKRKMEACSKRFDPGDFIKPEHQQRIKINEPG